MGTIRLAACADLPALLQLYTHLTSHPDSMPENKAEAIWAGYVAKGVRVFVSEADDQLVASCKLITVPNLTRGGRPYAFIENVETDAGHRQRGHGRAVVVAALDTAWREDCYKAMLLTGRSDDTIVSFYESCGFKRGLKNGYQAEPA